MSLLSNCLEEATFSERSFGKILAPYIPIICLNVSNIFAIPRKLNHHFNQHDYKQRRRIIAGLVKQRHGMGLFAGFIKL
jgi:hypothetical protein